MDAEIKGYFDESVLTLENYGVGFDSPDPQEYLAVNIEEDGDVVISVYDLSDVVDEDGVGRGIRLSVDDVRALHNSLGGYLDSLTD